MNDEYYMRRALDLAQQGLGRTAPNPSVGCVIVKNGEIIGAARTADGGRPHAETKALAMAGENAAGATAYVTLEPCHTHGQTAPCSAALIESGIKRVVIACRDPFQQKDGSVTEQQLNEAGIETVWDVCGQEALSINKGFFLTVQHRRPFVTAKIATSSDNMIAGTGGQTIQITGDAAQQRVHEMRASHDAIMVGINTVLTDDPLLTVRLPDHDGLQPLRIVIDRDLKIPRDCNIIKTAKDHPVWVITEQDGFEADGVTFIHLEAQDGLFDPADILKTLAERGITRLLIEGGGITMSQFMKAGLAHEFAWFKNPNMVIGQNGVPAFPGMDIETLFPAAPQISQTHSKDLLEIYSLNA